MGTATACSCTWELHHCSVACTNNYEQRYSNPSPAPLLTCHWVVQSFMLPKLHEPQELSAIQTVPRGGRVCSPRCSNQANRLSSKPRAVQQRMTC